MLMLVGLPHSPAAAGNGGLNRWCGALTFDGLHHSRLFASHIGVAGEGHFSVKAEAAIKYVLTQNSILIRLLDGKAHIVHRYIVSVPYEDEATVRTGRETV